MLAALQAAGKVSERKLRLFACACCRRVWHLLDNRSRMAVDGVERGPDGFGKLEVWAVGEMEQRLKGRRASRVMMIDLPPWWRVVTTLLSGQTEWVKRLVDRINERVHARANDTQAALRAAPGDEVQAARAAWEAAQAAKAQEQAYQCTVLRDILGNPFRAVTVNPGRLTPGLIELARMMYEDRAFDRLPVLADALEAAGCADADILAHCRGPGPHTRGCWVVDLLLRRI
jgi:hypothetical protein